MKKLLLSLLVLTSGSMNLIAGSKKEAHAQEINDYAILAENMVDLVESNFFYVDMEFDEESLSFLAAIGISKIFIETAQSIPQEMLDLIETKMFEETLTKGYKTFFSDALSFQDALTKTQVELIENEELIVSTNNLLRDLETAKQLILKKISSNDLHFFNKTLDRITKIENSEQKGSHNSMIMWTAMLKGHKRALETLVV